MPSEPAGPQPGRAGGGGNPAGLREGSGRGWGRKPGGLGERAAGRDPVEKRRGEGGQEREDQDRRAARRGEIRIAGRKVDADGIVRR
ncbi:hypothetical protein GCM10022419_047650 [Nonomuraea rosea]|uniref:Uncharacterized protein n=1 Tax=Nonomuraea rosea TaxID=638574 RepID=A0ABP6X5S6_9ACTN